MCQRSGWGDEPFKRIAQIADDGEHRFLDSLVGQDHRLVLRPNARKVQRGDVRSHGRSKCRDPSNGERPNKPVQSRGVEGCIRRIVSRNKDDDSELSSGSEFTPKPVKIEHRDNGKRIARIIGYLTVSEIFGEVNRTGYGRSVFVR